MSSILTSVSDFYRNAIAEQTFTYTENEGYGLCFHPISRFDFLAGPVLGVAFLVQKVFQAAFYGLASLFTLGSNQRYLESFYNQMYNIGVCVIAIPVGFVGVIVPSLINRQFLNIPPEGDRRHIFTRELPRAFEFS